MKEIEVKKIRPCDLPSNLCMGLNYIYHTELSNFTVMFDQSNHVLYINHTIPDKDVLSFKEFVMFKGPVNNDESEGGLGSIGKYIMERYGIQPYMCLCDAWRSQQKATKMCEAAEKAKKLMPHIYSLDENEETGDVFDEFLAYHISSLGLSSNQKTAYNMVSNSTKYVFWLGYLAGKGDDVK